MSGTTTKARRVASAKGRQFLMASGIARGTARANSSPQLATPTVAPTRPVQMPALPIPGKDAYETAAAAAQSIFDTADRLLSQPVLVSQIAATKQPYDTAKAAVTAAVQANDFVRALQVLPAQRNAADAVLRGKSQANAVHAKQKQLAEQIGTFVEMEPILGNVKRSNLPQGMAKDLKSYHGDAGKEFKRYLDKMQAVEDAKAGVNPKEPVAAAQAGDIKAKCGEMIVAAQEYLAHFETAYANKVPSKNALARKQQCEEGIKSASQYALAMEVDIAGKPTANAPWARETQMRMAGAKFAFRLEEGNKKLRGLDDDGGGKGASDSYWARNKSIGEVVEEQRTGVEADGKRTYIFKPMDGENNPDGMNSPQGAGAAKEALASANAKLFAAQTGIELGVPDTTVVSVGQYAMKNGNMSAGNAVGSAQQIAAKANTDINALPNDIFEKIKPVEVQKMALLDIMSLSMDRHGGNLMVDLADPNDPKLIPIDHGGSLPSREDFPKAKKRMAGLIPAWKQESSNPVNVLLTMPSAFEPFDPEILAGLEALDPAAIEAEMRAQLAAMDQVHPDLDASQKVGPDSLAMSKRSMMFVKKAAKTLSPAEVQIALGRRGEELFDATDANFDTVADQIIADMATKRGAYKELMSLSGKQRYEMDTFLEQNGWSSSAAELMMRDPDSMLKLFKSKTANAAPLPLSPFETPKPATGQVFSQQDKDAMKAAFPNSNPDKIDQLAAYQEFINKNYTTQDVTTALQRLGGKPPNGPVGALKIVQGWAELQKPAFQQERATLPFPADKPAAEALEALATAKLDDQMLDQIAAMASAAVAPLDPAAISSRFASDTLATSKSLLDTFFDAARATAGLAEWQRLTAKLANGPIPNQTAADFGKEVEGEAKALYEAVTKAGLTDARAALATVEADLQGLIWPKGAPALETEKYERIDIAKTLMGGAGHLHKAQAMVARVLNEKADILAIAVPMAAPQQVPAQANAPVQPPQQPAAPLPPFDWTQARASAVKKQAVTLGLFKDKDSGMTDALKSVNKAREAADTLKSTASTATKRKIFTAAEEACHDFQVFINSKLRGLSQDERWSGFCDSAAIATEAEFDKYSATRKALG